MTPRPTTLLPELEKLLSKHPAAYADAVRRVVGDLRPCVRVETRRAADVPIRGRRLDRMLRRPPPQPVLPVLASKFGGLPYTENGADIEGRTFIGQINFAEVGEALTATGSAIPAGMPLRGLLAVDWASSAAHAFCGHVRWYPDPDERKAVRPGTHDWIAKYEALMGFRGSWSLRGLEWFDAVTDDDELWEYLNELEIAGVDEDGRIDHKLFGHPNEALNEHYGIDPAPGRSDSIRDYALIWRITFDNAAGFAWGTNWLYVVIHKDDLAQGAFENARVTGANA